MTTLAAILLASAAVLSLVTLATAGTALWRADRRGHARGLKEGVHLGRRQLLAEQRQMRQRLREARLAREAASMVRAALDDASGGAHR